MSAIAECFIIEDDQLSALRAVTGRQRPTNEAPGFDWHRFLDEASVSRLSYGWSGYVLATLLSWLDEHGIGLADSEHRDLAASLSSATGGSFFIFTEAHRRLFLDALEPSNFDLSELRAYYEAFNAAKAEGVERPMLDGIRLFHEALDAINERTVAILAIT